MMSNWNRSSSCQMATSTAGIGPMYTMGMPQSKSMLAMGGAYSNNNKLPSSRSFSTIGLGLVGNFFQKITSMLIPTEAQTSALEKNKQSFSAPDIYVDMTINTPIFETTQGKAKLSIPEDKETTCDQTKSLSAGNSPFDWCPFREQLDVMKHTGDELDRPRKRMKPVVKPEADANAEKGNCIRKRRALNLIHPQVKPKTLGKNRKEKDRHNLLVDIMEDFRQISDESDMEEDNCDFTPTMSCEIKQTTIWPITSSSANVVPPLDFSEKSFPAMCMPAPQATSYGILPGRRMSCSSDCDSEDSYVMFSEDVQMTTPSASPAVRKNFCATINKMFIPRRLARPRQISECSDDYIVFCDSDDQEPAGQRQPESDAYSDEDDSDELDEDSCEEDSDETLSPQPDSGFEEKKVIIVKFNLKPEVHVMRTWDYAYRAARKGEWEMAARDRERFKKRIEETEQILKPVLGGQLRERVYCERFSC